MSDVHLLVGYYWLVFSHSCISNFLLQLQLLMHTQGIFG